MSTYSVPRVVAHRGYARRYPENTLPAFEAALTEGVPLIEFDIQLTADSVPVVLHDDNLKRTAAVDRAIMEVHSSELGAINVNEAARFGEQFAQVALPTLAETVEFLADWPQASYFVEIKRQSAEAFGVDAMVERVVAALTPVLERCIIISFVERAVQSARRLGASRVGWLLNYYDDDARHLADAIAPDFLMCDHQFLPPAPAPLWQGPWAWGFYEVVEAELAISLAERGAVVVESMACVDLLRDPRMTIPEET